MRAAVQCVVAPSLTPDSYTVRGVDATGHHVVAPSLTPDSYTVTAEDRRLKRVVAPSLTPDSYTRGRSGGQL